MIPPHNIFFSVLGNDTFSIFEKILTGLMAPKGVLCGFGFSFCIALLVVFFCFFLFFVLTISTTEVIKAGVVTKEVAIVASTGMLAYM